MGNIVTFLKNIITAEKGKDVRQSMHDAIKQVYDDAAQSGNANMEVTLARGTEPNLNARLEKMDEVSETTTAQLATLDQQKADQSFVDLQFANIVSGSPKGTYTTLSALQTAYPTGTSGVFLVLENGHWYYWNGTTWVDGGIYQGTKIGSQAIAPYNVYSYQTTNLLIVEKVTQGYYARKSDGVLMSNASMSVTDFISVTNGDVIYMSNGQQNELVTYYDSNKAYLSGISGNVNNAANPYIFTVNQSNVAYMRINIQDSKYPIAHFRIAKGSLTNFIKSGKYSFDWLNIINDNVLDNSLNGNKLIDKTINPSKLISSQTVPNLLKNVSNGFYVSIEQGGILVANASMAVSDYIAVINGMTLTISNRQQNELIAFYDSNKVFLGGLHGNVASLDPYTFTINQENVAYMRVNMQDSKYPIANFLIIEGDIDDYNNYGSYSFDWLRVDYKNIYNTPPINRNDFWLGAKLYTFGDSITNRDRKTYNGEFLYGYQYYIEQKLGAIVTNYGKEGYTTSWICGVITGTDLTNVDAITISGGPNDFKQGLAMGELMPIDSTNFNGNSTIGALQRSIQYAYEQNPLIRIYLLAPIQMKTGDLSEYNEAFKSVGELYGIPVLCMGKEVPINKISADVLTQDGTHPNNKGYEIMGNTIVGFLESH